MKSKKERKIGQAKVLSLKNAKNGQMKKISLKSQRRMQQDAARGRWYNLVELRRVPEFAAWLANEDHGWLGQSPDVSEILRMHRDGTTIVVWYDGRRTICGRHVMALCHTVLCFRDHQF